MFKKCVTAIRGLVPWIAPLFPLLLIAGYSLLYYLQHQPWEGNVGHWRSVAAAMTGLALLWLLIHLLLCAVGTRKEKIAARVTLIFPILLYLAALVVVEQLYPVRNAIPVRYSTEGHRYSSIQKNLQRQLERRSTEIRQVKRGITITSQTDSFGWPGEDRPFRSDRRRIVFIGDSFITVRSTRNLARRVEDILREDGEDVDIINLSVASTDPEDYRYRFNEIAFNYDPELVVLFIYGANDLSPRFRYWSYRHPAFLVTSEALFFLRANEHLSSEVVAALEDLQRSGKQFHSKDDFLSRFRDYGVSPEQLNLIYLTVFAYSGTEWGSFPLERWAPHTLIRMTRLWEKLFPPPEKNKSRWETFQPAYREIFDLPRDQRLERIAELSARFNNSPDKALFYSRLQALPKEFLRELLAEPDITYYLWPAITKLVLNKPGKQTIYNSMVVKASEEYYKLFREMQKQARRRNTELAVVLIPEASQVDEAFYQFWKPLQNFRELMIQKHTLLETLAHKLQPGISTLNLLDYRDRLSGSYWHFDGHWNEKGNAVVADIVSDYILRRNRESPVSIDNP